MCASTFQPLPCDTPVAFITSRCGEGISIPVLSDGVLNYPETVCPTLCLFLLQFEVINKDDQQALPAPLPLLHQTGDRLRPPRPAVRLSMQPYTATRQSRRHSQGSSPAEASAAAAAGGYQSMALLPVSEPCGMDAGHLFDSFPGRQHD